MAIKLIETTQCTCNACGHAWIPVRCANCKSPAWNKDGVRSVGRPRKVNDAPAVREEKVTPVVQEEDPPAETVPLPIERQSPVKVAKSKPWKEVKAPAGKKKICPHGFAIVSGVTACARCS